MGEGGGGGEKGVSWKFLPSLLSDGL